MILKIYQIDHERDSREVKFMPYSWLQRNNIRIDPAIYKQVFAGRLDCRNLEEVFTLLNTGTLYSGKIRIDKPDSCKGHSLSVSDVVQVIADVSVPAGYYYCDSMGFKEITPQELEL